MPSFRSGRVRGDTIECAYHGLRFAPDGACVHIPSQTQIPAAARVRSYPAVEKYHWIWIWPGDPALADESRIPDFGVMDHPDWNWRGETLEVAGNAMLAIENLMDLSHLPALHRTTLADTAIPENDIPVEYRIDGDTIRVDRWVLDTPVPPYFRLLADFAPDARVDRWMNTVFTPPAFVRIDIGAAEAGTGARDGDRSKAVTTWNLNAITPETADKLTLFLGPGAGFRRRRPERQRARFRAGPQGFPGGSRGDRRPAGEYRPRPGRPAPRPRRRPRRHPGPPHRRADG